MLERFTKRQKIIFLITALVALIFLSSLFGYLSRKSDEKVIDYKSANGENIIADSAITYDKIKFYELQDIITKFINSYLENDEDNTNYKNYYKTLTDEYKKYLSKSKYYEVTKNLCNKFVVTDSVDITKMMRTNGILKSVYVYDTDKYICKLQGNNEEVSYIGIKLIENTKEPYAQIFYLE